MQIDDLMDRFGGLATRARLIEATSRAAVDRALRDGTLVRVGQGRYTVAGVDEAASLAHSMNGVLSLTSAALHHGWEVKLVPERPHVLVPRNRNVPARFRGAVQLHRGDLDTDDISGGIATSREVTLLQCLRQLPDDEALAIADSALRAGEDATLRRIATAVRGFGSAKVRRIAAQARGEAANPFESVLRSIALSVPGLHVEPQLVISSPHVWARPDLVDKERRMVIEAESVEWHATAQGLRKDVRRYTLLTAEDWIVLRFLWEDAMHRRDWVRGVLERTVAGVDTRTQPRSGLPPAA